MKMNKRVIKGISGMILTLVASVGTIIFPGHAQGQCTVQLNVNQNTGTCVSQVAFSATASANVQSWTYYLDGEIVGTSSSLILSLVPGVYTGSVLIVTDQNCTAVDDFIFTVAGAQVSVDAGADVLACQEQAQLSVDVVSPNPYSVQWSPSVALSDPTSENPIVVQNVFEQQFVVEVQDAITGCIYLDSVLVTQHNPLFDTLEMCNGPVTIDLGPGGLYYQWLSYTDPDGNNYQLNYPATQQSIMVNNPGQYFMYANYPDCGALTSLVTVVPCNACWNLFSYNVSPQTCYDLYQFVSTSSAQPGTHFWDFGDGSTSTAAHPTHNFGPGVYEVELTIMDVNQCISTTSQTITVTGLNVAINEDTIACNGQLMLFSGATGGSGNYAYSWSPTVYMTSPTSQNTMMNVQGNMWAYVTVFDTQSQCSAIDSVYVYGNQQINETIELCGQGAVLTVDQGSLIYNWTYVPAGGGTSTSLPNQTNQLVAYNLGTYTVMTYYSGCQQVFHQFDVVACPTTCTSAITSNLQYQNCGALVSLIGSFSSPIDSAVWDLGNGDTFVQTTTPPQVFYPGGSYLVSLTAYHTSGCISTTTYSIILLTEIVATINWGDTIACSGQLFFGLNATGGSGQYAYSWYPPNMFSSPTSQNPTMIVTQDTWIDVAVTDTYTGCTDYDSLYVYANEPINETIELCGPGVVLTVDPGSMVYNWSYVPVGGGNATQLPQQTNALQVVNLGTYSCMTYSSGCQVITHTFEVVACGANCSVVVTSSFNPINCGAWYAFFANTSVPTDSIVFDFGDGTGFTTNGISASHFYPSGSYTLTVIAYHVNGCISTYTDQLTVGSAIAANISADTVACNGGLSLWVSASGGSGQFTYDWTPANAMNNPSIASPWMTVTQDTWVTVTVIDPTTGCTATDSMFVYSNAPISQTLELCQNSVLLEVDPGSMVYQWTYVDPLGNQYQLSNNTNSLLATAVGSYAVFTYYSGCNTITHTFIVLACSGNDDVWPGDANSNNIVTNADALYLGLAFNQTGPVRPAATLNWVGQACPDWLFNFAVNNVNLKHADCDGNGIINFNDTLAIDFNYLLTHNKFEAPPAGGSPLLWIEATPDTVGLEQAIDIVVHLGTESQPVDGLHGVSFSLTFNETLVTQNGFTVDFDNCVLGTAGSDLITMQKSLFSDGAIDLVVTRNTLQDFSGYGPIAHARIVTTDNLSGITALPIGLSGVFALNASEEEVYLSVLSDTVIIDPNKVGIDEAEFADLSVYPNPSSGTITIEGLELGTTIRVMNSLGQTISAYKAQAGRTVLELDALSNGVYFLRFESVSSVAVRKIRILR